MMLSIYVDEVLEKLRVIENAVPQNGGNDSKITVNELAGKAGVLYEKIRYLVDYKDEHSIRRNAIERILKRKVIIEHDTAIGVGLLRELVGGGYLPNDTVFESASDSIQQIIDKYLLLASQTSVKKTQVISFAASEIERLIFPNPVDDASVNLFYKTVQEKVTYAEAGTVENANIQTYIGCRRRLLRDDKESLLYAVLLQYMPALVSLSESGEIRARAVDFAHAVEKARTALESPLNWRVTARLRNMGVYFAVVQELLHMYSVEEVSALLHDEERLQREVEDLISEKHKQQYNKASKSGTRAIIYILLTKTIIAVLIELPYDIFILHSIQYVALATNILFHPLLLFFLVKTIKAPSDADVAVIVEGVKNVVSETPDIPAVHIKPHVQGVVVWATFILFYWILFVASFGIILAVLGIFDFSAVSAALFIFFLTLVSYFGFRIRYVAEKWRVRTRENDSVIGLLFHFLAVPIVQTGRWLSERFASVNIFIFIMDFMIETPFKLLLGTFDAFISFLKEQRDNFY